MESSWGGYDLKNYTKKERSWALYDWANSAFTLVIITAIMPIYFKNAAEKTMSEESATAIWGFATSTGTLILAIMAPVLGTLAAYIGFKKRLFKGFLIAGAIFTASLALLPSDNWQLLLGMYVIAFLCYEATIIFYDSFIVDATVDERMNKVSSFGYALGYFGSTIPFIVCIAMIMLLPDQYTILATKASFVITAVWWIAFSIPLIKNVEQKYGVAREDHFVGKSFTRLKQTMIDIYHHKNLFLFLLAFFFYIDGVNTVISMAASFASDVGMKSDMLLVLIFVIQVVAIPFAILYGKLADKFGIKKVIYFGICTYIVLCIYAYFVHSALGIYIIGFMIASAQGGIQALSRSFFAKIVPKEKSNEYFGFYSIFSKFAAVIGPALMGITISIVGSTNAGVLSLVILFVIGGSIFHFVKDEAAATQWYRK